MASKKVNLDLAEKRLSEWFNLTEQQLKILLSMYALELEGADVYPTYILAKYNLLYHHDIRRQNLFTQMKPLLEKGMIKRKDRKKYEVDISALHKLLNQKKEMLTTELNSIDAFALELEEKMREIASRKNKPHVMYLDDNEYMTMIGNRIPYAENVYIFASAFPNVAYSRQIVLTLKRKTFYEAISRCVTCGKPNLHYLTSLAIELPYKRALNVYRNPIKAYNETIKMIDHLSNLIRNCPNLDVRYWDHAIISPTFVLEGPNRGEVFMSLKGGEATVHGLQSPHVKNSFPGVYINSAEIAQRTKESFYSFFKDAIPLNSKEGEKLINLAKERLKKL